MAYRSAKTGATRIYEHPHTLKHQYRLPQNPLHAYRRICPAHPLQAVFFKFHASLGQAGAEFAAIFYIVQWNGLMRRCCRARGTTGGHGWFI